MLSRLAISSLMLLGSVVLVASEPVPVTTIEDILADPVIERMLLSPDGEHLAGVGPFAFQFMDSETLQMSSKRITVDLKARESIMDFRWISNDRVLYTVDMIVGPSPFPWWPNNWYAVNANGNRHSNPFNRGADAGDTQLRFVDVNESNPRTIFMQEKEFRNYREIYESTPSIIELDIYSKRKGKRTNRQNGPVSYGDLFVDREGVARVATGFQRGLPTMHYRASREDDWRDISEESGISGFGLFTRFLGFRGDNQSFYVLGSNEDGFNSLFLFAPSEEQYGLVYSHDEFDLAEDGFVWNGDQTEIIGVTLMDPFSTFEPISNSDRSIQYWSALSQHDAFTGSRLSIAGISRDSSTMLLLASNSMDPGTYYLFRPQTQKVDIVASKMSGVDSAEMSLTRTYRIRAKDDLRLYVNLTVPKNVDTPVPLVVLPHAGPMGVHDSWGFNREVQAYALNGYAVVQVDYRGGAGRGTEFTVAGFGEWAGAIIDDVLLATSHVAKRDQIDGDRICIAGSHYGAFIALAAAVREPDTFKCAIGIQGLYDLSLMWNGAAPAWPISPDLLRAAIGTDLESLAAASPANNADKLTIPVFLSHGGKDGFAPPRHHHAMVSALRHADVEHVNFDEISGQHGFRGAEHRVRLFTQILDFLDEHM